MLTLVLSRRSARVLAVREGLALTSISHGLRLSSMMMSNPASIQDQFSSKGCKDGEKIRGCRGLWRGRARAHAGRASNHSGRRFNLH